MSNPKGRVENLKPLGSGKLTPEEERAMRVAGGKRSQEVLRLKRTQADILRQILALEERDPERRELLISMGLDGNVADSINIAVTDKAKAGDVEATRYIRDTIGEKPREGLELGNLDDKPLASVDLSKLSDEQLKAMAAARKAGKES